MRDGPESMDRWRGIVDERLRSIDERQAILLHAIERIRESLDQMSAWQNKVIGMAVLIPSLIAITALVVSIFRGR